MLLAHDDFESQVLIHDGASLLFCCARSNIEFKSGKKRRGSRCNLPKRGEERDTGGIGRGQIIQVDRRLFQSENSRRRISLACHFTGQLFCAVLQRSVHASVSCVRKKRKGFYQFLLADTRFLTGLTIVKVPSRELILKASDGIKVWTRGAERVSDKPLLVLYALRLAPKSRQRERRTSKRRAACVAKYFYMLLSRRFSSFNCSSLPSPS